MRLSRTLGWIAGSVAAGAIALSLALASPSETDRSLPELLVGEHDGWASRTVWACDRRKAVVVQGVRPGERMSPAKAQQVADLLMDLMRFCNQEVIARISVNQRITLSVNGLPYTEYIQGGDLPIQLVHSAEGHGRREQAIWQAELDKLLSEGDRLFHSDEIGANGIACAMCHPHGTNTHPETYPKFQTQLKKIALLRDMVNWCIENPMEGPPLAADDPRMIALESYILSSRNGVPIEVGKH